MSLQEKIENARKQAEESLNHEIERLTLIDYYESLMPGFQFTYGGGNLYGASGCLSMKPDLTHDIFRVIEYKDIIELSRLIEPVPLERVDDGCCSFMPTEFIESLDPKKVERWQSEIEVVPFTIRFSCFQDKTMTFSWFGYYFDKLIRVKVEIPMDPDIADLSMGFITEGLRRHRIKTMNFSPNKKLVQVIKDIEGNNLAEMQSPIKWYAADEYQMNTLCTG
jgi:hypothetical protein